MIAACGDMVEPRADIARPQPMAVDIGQALHDHEADHAKRGKTGQKADRDQQRQDVFGPGPDHHDRLLVKARLGQIVQRRLGRPGKDLPEGAGRGRERAGQLGPGRIPEIDKEHGQEDQPRQGRDCPEGGGVEFGHDPTVAGNESPHGAASSGLRMATMA
jgi:hypothetical protein